MNTTPNFEVPGAMRDLAEKSVGQARKAFDSFIGAARRAASTTQDATEAAGKNAQDMAAHSFQAAEQNVHAAFDFAQKLAQAKSLKEAMELQSEFTRTQFATIQAQAKELSGMAQKAVQHGTEQARSAAQDSVDQSRMSMEEGDEATQPVGTPQNAANDSAS